MNPQGPRWLTGLGLAAVLLAGGCTGGGRDGAAPGPSASATVKSYEKSVAGVVEASEAFLATLDDDGRAEVQLEFTEENAVAWSDRPCGPVCRPGMALAGLDPHQLAAAKSVLRTALGAAPDAGYERIEEIMLAQERPGAAPTPGDGYFLAYLGEPTAEGTWQLKFGGPQLAVHLTYQGGRVTSASPYAAGAEPVSWTDSRRTRHEPLGDMRTALLALTGSLNGAQKKAAQLRRTHSDVLLGPRADGQFPATKEGLAGRSLTAAQRKLVAAAIARWVAGADDDTAAALMAGYQKELDRTYVGWSGRPGLTAPGDYVRIDGPSVWVEFVCQKGAVVRNQVGCRTIYRDRTRDYGGALPFS